MHPSFALHFPAAVCRLGIKPSAVPVSCVRRVAMNCPPRQEFRQVLAKVLRRLNRFMDCDGACRNTVDCLSQNQTGRKRDADLSIHAVQAAIAAEVKQPLSIRFRSNSPKRSILFTLKPAASPFRKKWVKAVDENGEKQLVKFLADGQQSIIAGVHPTGALLQWTGPHPAEVVDWRTGRSAGLAPFRIWPVYTPNLVERVYQTSPIAH
jgi:hypothetical protein